MKAVSVGIALCFAMIVFAQGNAPKELTGDWEGTSLCTVPSSPCRNEHVVYHFSPEKGSANAYTISADKIVNGEPQNMGDLHCTYDPAKGYLKCVKPGVWEFQVAGDNMTGTLKLDDGTLYRKVEVKRKK